MTALPRAQVRDISRDGKTIDAVLLASYLSRLAVAIEQSLAGLTTLPGTIYSVTNLTQLRTMDASSASASDVRSVLGTVIYDLQGRRLLP